MQLGLQVTALKIKRKLDNFVKQYNDYYWFEKIKFFRKSLSKKDRNWMNDTGISLEYYKISLILKHLKCPIKVYKTESGIVNVKKEKK